MMKQVVVLLCLLLGQTSVAQVGESTLVLFPEDFAKAQGTAVISTRSDQNTPGGAVVIAARGSFSALNTWDDGVSVPASGPISSNDVALLTVWARCTSSMTGEGTFQLHAERIGDDWFKLVSGEYQVSGEWTRFDLPFVASKSFAGGEWQLAIHTGFMDQTLEFTGATARVFSGMRTTEGLPATRLEYRGRDEGAQWRADAFARIQAMRVSPLRVSVTDAEGAPLAGATVRAEMVRSAFSWGTAVAAPMFAPDSPGRERYLAEAERMFNEIVFENAMKWNNYGLGTPKTIGAGLDWAEAKNIAVRGHTLVWPSWRYVPDELRSLESDPDALREAILERVCSTVSQYAGRITDWDTVNEVHANFEVIDAIGDRGVITEWFHAAHEADPQASLFVNDYGILIAGERWTPHQQSYLELIRSLKAEGAPIAGIGMQGHFAATLTPPERMLEVLDTFAAEGLPIKVTELDITTQDRSLQADFFRDVLITAYSHPGVEGVLLWGFWADRHWRPDAALFESDWTPTPQVRVWDELVLDAWRSTNAVQSDTDGEASIACHHGEYRIVVEFDGQTVESRADVLAGGTAVQIRIDVGDSP